MANMFRCTLASGGGAFVLTVTCHPNFAGLTITATDGTTTLTQTCPSASPYVVEFKIPNGGQWIISGIISNVTYSTIVNITDTAELSPIPEGSTVTPTDDIQTWLNCANIWDKAYTTISQVLADASTLQALIASSNAVDYMARSTTWASSVTADSSAMTYIGLDNYCADALLADSTWLAAICNSTYFENVLTAKVPTMTSATTPSGKVSVSSTLSGSSATYKDYYAFDKNNSTKWYSANNTQVQWIKYEFVNPIRILKYLVKFDWKRKYKIQASNDDSNWTDLTNEYTPSTTTEEKSEVINNNNYYKYIRLYAPAPSSSIYIGIQELQFYGRTQ